MLCFRLLCYMWFLLSRVVIIIFLCIFFLVFFFKQKTAYEMRISDWSSDVCSSDLMSGALVPLFGRYSAESCSCSCACCCEARPWRYISTKSMGPIISGGKPPSRVISDRSEEHTSELQSLMRISYAVFCLNKKKTQKKYKDKLSKI